MNYEKLVVIKDDVACGKPLALDDALTLCNMKAVNLYDLMHCANFLREKFFGNRIKFCSIINAKSGVCTEDCAFCAQSAHHHAAVATYPLLSKDKLVAAGKNAWQEGAFGFSIVTSGRGVPEHADAGIIADTFSGLRNDGHYLCASMGELTADKAAALKTSGLKRYHHNLETAESFFADICATHTYQDRVTTLRIAKEAGLEVCSGGIFGLGESWEQRIEMAFALRELKVDSIPINFLNPVKGTPLGDRPVLEPREALRIIALYRFIFPDKDITICGGREKILRDMQSWMFYAGANGTMLGNYLTTAGRPAQEDKQMLIDLGLTWD
jgi:biotin synthase